MDARILAAMMMGALGLGLAGCATDAGDGDEELAADSAEELAFAGSGRWTVFPLTTGPNPAAKIRGDVSGFVSPEIRRTILRLAVSGLPPSRTFGAHLHATPCAQEKGGGHYQHTGNTVSAENEVWLDFRTNAAGVANVVARKPWAVETSRARSVVVHAMATDAATGKAGDKLACVDVSFSDVATGAPPSAGRSCSSSYQCVNGACRCGEPKAGTTCASPSDCEKTCAVCK